VDGLWTEEISRTSHSGEVARAPLFQRIRFTWPRFRVTRDWFKLYTIDSFKLQVEYYI